MDWVRRRWDAFWFAPRSCVDLAVCRIVLYAGLLVVYGPHDLSALGEASPVLWAPLSFYRWLGPQPSPEAIRLVEIAWRVALACAAVGLGTRVAAVVAFAAGVYLMGLPNNFGALHLDDAMLVLTLGAMALARSGDCLSVDRWLAARRGSRIGTRPSPHASGEYTWPIRLVWVLMATMYFGAGFAKLRMSGLDWVTSDHVARLLAEHLYGVDPPPATTWGPEIAARPALYYAMTASEVLIELGFPIALVSRRARWVILPAAYLSHVGIRLVLGSNFLALILAYAFWVPWGALANRLGVRLGGRGAARPVVR